MADGANPGTSQRLKELRLRCEERMKDLPLPAPFDLDAFCQTVAGHIGRRIVLQPVADVGGQTMGAWIRAKGTDIIVYEKNTTRLHQEHIVLHELSHIICKHKTPLLDPAATSKLFPDLRADVVRGVLKRQSYSTAEELEAEVQASVIRERATGKEPAEPPTKDVDAPILRRLEAFRRGESPD
ncbi:MAG TPA: hypothetical protein VNG70_11485 [Candidatus Limnocylindria bacterium]|nr:hypothetical protein [Candidatus Limnocylindria bacterium]